MPGSSGGGAGVQSHHEKAYNAPNNFSFESEGLCVWKAYNVGPGKLFSPVQVKGLGPLQGPTAFCSPSAFRCFQVNNEESCAPTSAS